MSLDPTTLFLSLLFSTVGGGFFIYGKKQRRPLPLVVGLGLMVYPYFVRDITVMVSLGIGLILVPIVANKFFS